MIPKIRIGNYTINIWAPDSIGAKPNMIDVPYYYVTMTEHRKWKSEEDNYIVNLVEHPHFSFLLGLNDKKQVTTLSDKVVVTYTVKKKKKKSKEDDNDESSDDVIDDSTDDESPSDKEVVQHISYPEYEHYLAYRHLTNPCWKLSKKSVSRLLEKLRELAGVTL